MLEIRLTRQAEHAYMRVDERTRARFDKVLEQLERGQLDDTHIRALRGTLAGSYRYRLGEWRVVFSVDRRVGILWVEAITTRGSAYK